MMLNRVPSVRLTEDKIFNPVVQRFAIDVMNCLSLFHRPANLELHNQTMLKYVSHFSPTWMIGLVDITVATANKTSTPPLGISVADLGDVVAPCRAIMQALRRRSFVGLVTLLTNSFNWHEITLDF